MNNMAPPPHFYGGQQQQPQMPPQFWPPPPFAHGQPPIMNGQPSGYPPHMPPNMPMMPPSNHSNGAQYGGPPMPPYNNNGMSSNQSVSSTPAEPPGSPVFPSSCPTPTLGNHINQAEVRQGVGVVTWLSTQAGLLQSEEFGTISFQLKCFCDLQVSDLTSVLRPGYRLKFKATPSGDAWNAVFVVPVQTHELKMFGELAAEVEKYSNGDTGPPQLARDPYDLAQETDAIPMLLQIFEKQQNAHCQLSSFHCHISNCGNDQLFRYVGTSSLKRRQFLERRTHLFHMDKNDLVSLQPAPIYVTVMALHAYILSRGGACLLQELWEYFSNTPNLPIEAREAIGDGKRAFLNFLTTHTWILSVFPSKVFVGARRQLPEFDYSDFINTNFPEHDLRQGNASPSSAAAARRAASISRTASVAPRANSASVSESGGGPAAWGGAQFKKHAESVDVDPTTISPPWTHSNRTSGSSAADTPPPGITEMNTGTAVASFWASRGGNGNAPNFGAKEPSVDTTIEQMRLTVEQALTLYRMTLTSTATQTDMTMASLPNPMNMNQGMAQQQQQQVRQQMPQAPPQQQPQSYQAPPGGMWANSVSKGGEHKPPTSAVDDSAIWQSPIFSGGDAFNFNSQPASTSLSSGFGSMAVGGPARQPEPQQPAAYDPFASRHTQDLSPLLGNLPMFAQHK